MAKATKAAANKKELVLACEMARLAFLYADSALSPMTTGANASNIGDISFAVIRYWDHASYMHNCAEHDDKRGFEEAYIDGSNKAKYFGQKYLDMRAWFVNANTQLGGLKVEAIGRTFSSAHQALYDLAGGLYMAAVAANHRHEYQAYIERKRDGDFGSLFPITSWPIVRDAIAKLTVPDMSEIIDLARRECSVVLLKVRPAESEWVMVARKDLPKILGIAETTIRNRIKDGKLHIRGEKNARYVEIRADDLRRYEALSK